MEHKFYVKFKIRGKLFKRIYIQRSDKISRILPKLTMGWLNWNINFLLKTINYITKINWIDYSLCNIAILRCGERFHILFASGRCWYITSYVPRLSFVCWLFRIYIPYFLVVAIRAINASRTFTYSHLKHRDMFVWNMYLVWVLNIPPTSKTLFIGSLILSLR